MSKRTYRAVPVHTIDAAEVLRRLGDHALVVVGCDAAKDSWRGALMTSSSDVVATLSWSFGEIVDVVSLLVEVQRSGVDVHVVAEPTGTYADAFAFQVRRAGLEMFMVSSKHTHDYAEIYDGVPSQHDSKDAAVVAKVHLERRQHTPWPTPTREQRELRARCAYVDWLKQEHQRDHGRAEALLARHWPELTNELDLNRASLAMLLKEFGSAQAVAADPARARRLLQKQSRGNIAKDKLERILTGARHTIGLPATASEQQLLQDLGKRLLERRRELREAEFAATRLASSNPAQKHMSGCLGPMTATLFLALIGDPSHFRSTRALFKVFGINLRERSSGKHKGQLKITKRGNPRLRQWLYLAALRLLKTDAIAAAWVAQKAKRAGGMKMKAIIGLMRKIVSALRHVAAGARFDSAKLFDVRRLKRLRALPENFHVARHAAC